MEERILKKSAIFITLISICICVIVPFFSQISSTSQALLEAVKEYRTKTKAERLNMTGLELLAYNNKQAKEESEEEPEFDSQLRLELPLGVSGQDLEVAEDYVTQTIDIRIPYADE